MEFDYSKSADFLGLQPLRIPAGWSVGWNTLYATSKVEEGDFGGSSIFHATNSGRRFSIDVEFRPEFDPSGQFYVTVTYQPWPRTDRGRRKNNEPVQFDANAEIVHTAETRVYSELVSQLETWIARCTTWVREGH
jgi:hypothetical protein